MNALLRKEIRLLRPSFVTALLLACSVWLVPTASGPNSGLWVLLMLLPCGLCPVMAVVMALDTFGREFSLGTFSDLLSQPISRARIWRTKTLVLAVALTLIAAVCWISFRLHHPSEFTEDNVRPMTIAVVLIALAAFAGGLWTVLLIRQGAAAFWFALLVPAALLMIVAELTERHPNATEPALITVFIAYATAGFFWARRIFLGAQDVHWTGGTIALPAVRGLSSVLGWMGTRRRRRPRAALLAKELQLHQSQLVIAGVLALLHLGLLAARKIGGGFKDSPVLGFVADHFWTLWLMMPLLIGCAAVAEERKLGTWEAQLCLPVKRRTQFAIKVIVALGASLVLGVVAPVLLEGTRILPEVRFEFKQFSLQVPGGALIHWSVLDPLAPLISFLLPCWPLLALSAGFVAIAFYASTLTRSTLQSLAPAALGIVMTWLLLLGADEKALDHRLWRGWLIYLIGVPAMIATLAGLSYWNCKRVLVGWTVWRRNGIVVLGSLAFVIVATTATYHRVWELVVPLEPPHGAARLAPGPDVSLTGDGVNLVAQLPGGRVWTGRLLPTVQSLGTMLTGDWRMTNVFGGGRCLEGSNWTSVAVCYLEVVGIKQDGSLWISETPEDRTQYWRPRNAPRVEPIRMVRLGGDDDWKSAAGRYPPVFLLKTNGTLWRLGTDWVDWRKGRPSLRTFTPERLGTDSDWVDLSAGEGPTGPIQFRKADGRVWVLGGSGVTQADAVRFDDRISRERAPQYEGDRWRSRAKTYVPQRGEILVGVREDGTFRVCGAMQLNPKSRVGAWEWTKQDVQLGRESNWLAVAACNHFVATLKADGTVWKWSLPRDPMAEPATARAIRLGSHSDWVALCSYADGLVGLAADASLWFWANEPRDFHPSGLALRPLLAASRKPQFLGQVSNPVE